MTAEAQEAPEISPLKLFREIREEFQKGAAGDTDAIFRNVEALDAAGAFEKVEGLPEFMLEAGKDPFVREFFYNNLMIDSNHISERDAKLAQIFWMVRPRDIVYIEQLRIEHLRQKKGPEETRRMIGNWPFNPGLDEEERQKRHKFRDHWWGVLNRWEGIDRPLPEVFVPPPEDTTSQTSEA